MLATHSQQAPFQSASLYIGDLHHDVTEGLLFEMFNRVGPVASIRVCRDMVTRRSLGYAYVNFHNVSDAERALDTMNFTDIKSRPCRIMWSQRDPSLRKSGVGNVFVKNLAPVVDNKNLFDLFSVFGNILSCKVATDDQGVSKGYGYVHYETAEAAQEAIKNLNGNLIEEEEVYVGSFLRRQDRANNVQWTNLYVKQFPESWTDENLSSFFSVYGEVASCKISTDGDGKSKLFGFVDFKEHEAAASALAELNGKSIESGSVNAEGDAIMTTLYVSRAQKKIDRVREMKYRMDQLKLEQVNKFQGMNLYVKNLDDGITEEQFRDAFSQFGTITSASIKHDESNSTKGFGFICFSSPEEATRAMTEMNGRMLKPNGKPLFVALHQRKELRRAHLSATYSNRGQNGMPRGFPMGGGQSQMPGFMTQFAQPGQPIPRQPYPMMHANMMPRGPVQQYGGRGGQGGGYSVPQYGMMQGGGGQSKRGPVISNQGQNQGRRGMNNGPRGSPNPRGMIPQLQQGGRIQQNGVKYNSQVRNQPQQGNIASIPHQQMAGQPAQQLPQQSATGPLDHSTLALADPQTQKNMIGERLYPLILQHQPELAGKITGMLLEMDNAELLHLLESPDALLSKIEEALQVLEAHSQGGNSTL